MYGYVRRWRLVLLALGLILGGLAGLAYDYNRGDLYTATVEVHLRRDVDKGLPHIHFDIISDPVQTTEKAATENVTSKLDQFLAYTNVQIRSEVVVERNTSREPWWKGVVLGSIIGALLVIVGIYIWEDVRAYRRDRQEAGPDT